MLTTRANRNGAARATSTTAVRGRIVVRGETARQYVEEISAAAQANATIDRAAVGELLTGSLRKPVVSDGGIQKCTVLLRDRRRRR